MGCEVGRGANVPSAGRSGGVMGEEESGEEEELGEVGRHGDWRLWCTVRFLKGDVEGSVIQSNCRSGVEDYKLSVYART